MTNPYAPLKETEDVGVITSSSTALPAGLLVLLLIPTLLYDTWFATYVIAADIINASQAIGWSFSMIRDWGFLIKVIVVFSAHLLILVGAMRMWRHRSYWLAVTSCVVALIPVLTPALILGIPVGVWGLIVLRRDDVRSAFAAKRRHHVVSRNDRQRV